MTEDDLKKLEAELDDAERGAADPLVYPKQIRELVAEVRRLRQFLAEIAYRKVTIVPSIDRELAAVALAGMPYPKGDETVSVPTPSLLSKSKGGHGSPM